MPATWKQQALIEAPVTDVWSLLEDPDRYSQWNGETVAVTGVPTKIEKGSTFEVTGRGPLGMEATTTFKVEEFDDLHEIKLRCQTSGFYSHWILTDAQGGTFAEVEMGVERIAGLEGRIASAMHTKRYLRRAIDQTLDGVRRAVAAAGGLGGSAARK